MKSPQLSLAVLGLSTVFLTGGCQDGGQSGVSDTTPPTISSTYPADSESTVARDAVITASFNEDILPSSLADSVTVTDANGEVSGTLAFDAIFNMVSFTPDTELDMLGTYTVNLSGAITDLAGNHLSPMSWSFTVRNGSWGTVIPLEYDTAPAGQAQIAFDTNGNAIAVWGQSDTTTNNIWANRYTPGSGWGTPIKIEADDAGTAQDPQLAIDADGNALVVWQQSDGTRDNIWANRYTVGSGWGMAILIETDDTGPATAPQLVMDINGNATVVWRQIDVTQTSIWANRYTAGSGWGTASLIETDETGLASNPKMAIDDSGNVIVVWQQLADIWANRYTTGGAGWGTAELIENDETGAAQSQEIAIDANGNAIVVWTQIDVTETSVWANRYTAGGSWGTAELIENDETGAAQSPSIVIEASGNAMAVWRQSDGTRDNIWANRYTVGSGWGAAELIENDNAGPAGNPNISIDANGNVMAVWPQSDGTRDNIWANRYTVGSGWGAAELIEDDPSADAEYPVIATDDNGNAIAVWVLANNSTSVGLWTNRYTPSGGWGKPIHHENYSSGVLINVREVIFDANGNAFLLWAQGGGAPYSIWVNRYD